MSYTTTAKLLGYVLYN